MLMVEAPMTKGCVSLTLLTKFPRSMAYLSVYGRMKARRPRKAKKRRSRSAGTSLDDSLRSNFCAIHRMLAGRTVSSVTANIIGKKAAWRKQVMRKQPSASAMWWAHMLAGSLPWIRITTMSYSA